MEREQDAFEEKESQPVWLSGAAVRCCWRGQGVWGEMESWQGPATQGLADHGKEPGFIPTAK